MELALEGERLCKAGDLVNGIRFFEEAVKVGTSDERTISAIYSQLGNAYFYLEDFEKALKYHELDVELVKSIGDREAEAKACGNLGNTLKMIDEFDRAAILCKRSQEISKSLNDLEGEGRALYNLGNVYHTKGKRMIGATDQEPGELSDDIKMCLEQAICYYMQNLEIVSMLNDHSSMGRAFGNLGNTHYLLGNFEEAVDNHTKRLELARKTGEKSAQRRAHLNLGNANVFLGNFQLAVENYNATLELARELQDKFTEAHSCYSLANTYTFLRDYDSAIKYHLLYLETIKNLDDKLGEGRACWSLVNIYQMVNDHESALKFAKRHHAIAEQLGDKVGQESAKLNIEELESIIAQKQTVATTSIQAQQVSGSSTTMAQTNSQLPTTSSQKSVSKKLNADGMYTYRLTPDKRLDQEQRRFKKQLNEDIATASGSGKSSDGKANGGKLNRKHRSGSSEKLFDMIAHFQSGRIDDQRCEMFTRLTPSLSLSTQPKTKFAENSTIIPQSEPPTAVSHDNLASQSSCSSSSSCQSSSNAALTNNIKKSLKTSNSTSTSNNNHSSTTNLIQSSLNSVSSNAVSAIKVKYRKASLAHPSYNSSNALYHAQRRPTSVTAEQKDKLFELIAGVQGQRMDEQRAVLPATNLTSNKTTSKSSAHLACQNKLSSDQQLSDKQLARGMKEQATHKSFDVEHYNSSSSNFKQQQTRTDRIGSVGNAILKYIPTVATNKLTSSSSTMVANNSNEKRNKSQFLSSNNNNNNKQVFHQREKSHSITPLSFLIKESNSTNNNSTKSKANFGRQFSNVNFNATNIRDENFLDSLMKYQSTRFDDQRSEFPNKQNVNDKKKTTHEKDEFLNLIVKFQSDRINDQRSTPPSRNQATDLIRQKTDN